jgi:hypothetical protein
MVGRNRKFEGHSEWMNEFNKIHNQDYYYGKKTKEKKTQKKKTGRRTYAAKRHTVFKVSD